MNYSTLFQQFKREVTSMIQYNHLGSPFKALAIVATLPFWLTYGILLCAKYIYLFGFNALATSADYLEAWVKENKKSVNPLTEAVLYLVTMPFIFFIRCCLSMFTVGFYMLWFETMCYGYIASLGGVRWQPFISYVKYDRSIKCEVTTNKTAGGTITIIGFVFFCMGVLSFIIGSAFELYQLLTFGNIINYIYFLFMIIAVPLTFKKVVTGCDDDQDDSADVSTSGGNGNSTEEFPEI